MIIINYKCTMVIRLSQSVCACTVWDDYDDLQFLSEFIVMCVIYRSRILNEIIHKFKAAYNWVKLILRTPLDSDLSHVVI